MKKNGGKVKGSFARLKRIRGWPIITKTKSGTSLQSNGRFRIKAIDQLTSSRSIISGRLVIKGFVLAFLFTMIILGGLAWYTWHSNQHLKALETTHFRLLQLSGQITNMDEILTMSAHMAVETGEPKWKERYRDFEPQLDSAIKEVAKLSDEPVIKDAISRTDTANTKLVAIENRAFDLIDKGDSQTAMKIFHSFEYEKEKHIYSNAIYEISNSVSVLEQARIKKEQRIALTITVLLIATIPLVAFIWFTALRILRKYISERKQAEMALRMSEQCFHAIADYSCFWEIWINLNGRPIWTNPAAQQITGYSIKEIMAMQNYPTPLVYEEDRTKVAKAFKSALNGGSGREFQFRIRRKDASVIWAEMSWQPIYDEKNISIGHRVSIHDIAERKQAEESLRSSEEKFSKAFHASPDSITITSTDKGRILEVNEGFEKMFGYSRDEVLGKTTVELNLWQSGEDRDAVLKEFEEKSGVKDLEVHILDKAGDIHDCLLSCETIHIDAEPCLVSIARDITERKQVEEALLESEELFRDFFENAPIGFHIFGPDQIIADINEAELEMIGYSRKAIVGKKTWAELIVPQQRDMFEKHWHDMTTRGHVRNLEYTLVHKDGHYINVILNASARFDMDGNVVNTRGSVLNITARKQAERALKTSKKRLSLAFYAANDGLWDWDIKTGEVYFSPRYYTMLGYKPNEFSATFEAWANLLDPDQREAVTEKIREHIERKSESFEEEFRLKTKAGDWRWILSKGKVVHRGANNEPDRMVGTHSDITERKEAEEARQRLNKELEAKNKELEAILYAASHDLKSPLVNIQGFGYELSQSCDLIRSALMNKGKGADMEKAVEVSLNEDIPNALDFIMASTTKMDSLLSGLLDVSRLNTTPAAVKDIDINAMMSNITASMEYQIKESAAKIDIEDLPPCAGDSLQINRVFSNLLTNAVKFLDDSRPGRIHIYGKSQNGKSIYCVEDNGIGIAPEHQQKIFQIFYQHDPDKRKGEGIGLTIVRRIIEKHDGKIWVESEVGKGSKFFVSLPNV